MYALEIEDVCFSYDKNTHVLSDISMKIEKNTIFGLLGPNGAGKTTLLGCIQNLYQPTQGKIEILGMNFKQHEKIIKQKMGIQFQSNAYFEYLRVEEILKLFAILYGIELRQKEIISLLSLVNLQDKAKAFVGKLSGGQLQKINILLSIVHQPDILFLDEPTTGLDPQSRRDLWKIILDIQKLGTTIILTTHYMEEVEELCDTVCLLSNGTVYDIDSPTNLINKSEINSIITVRFNREVNHDTLLKDKMIKNIIQLELSHQYRIYTSDLTYTMLHIHKYAEENQIIITESTTHQTNLEDVFLHVTGRGLSL